MSTIKILIIISAVFSVMLQSCFMRPGGNSDVDPLEKMMYYTDKKIGADEDTTSYIQKIDSLMEILRYNIRTGRVQEAFKNVRDANILADTIGSAYQLARCYYYWGIVSARMSNVSISDKNYYSCLIYRQKTKDVKGISAVYRSWARSNYENNVFDSAKSFLNNYAFKIDSALKDSRALKIDHIYTGQMLLKLYRTTLADNDDRNLNAAYESFVKAQSIPVSLSETDCDDLLKAGLCETYYFMAQNSSDNPALYKNYIDSCRLYYNCSRKAVRMSNDPVENTRFFLMNINMLVESGDLKTAQRLADSVFAVKDTEAYHHKEGAMFAYSIIYEAKKDFEKALECKNQALVLQESNEHYRNTFTTSLQLGRGQMENDKSKAYAKKMELEGKSRSIMIISAVITTFIIIILMIIAYSRRRYKKINKIITAQKAEIEVQNGRLTAKNEEIKTQNEEIRQQNDEIKKQSEIIRSYNEELTSSINYASRIQFAALPSEDEIREVFGESLLIYKPKDIVSGDFYWIAQTQTYKVFAAADCTGHGVPGALLSMLGISSLEYSTRNLEQNHTKASEVLDRMKAILKNTLNQGDFENDNHDAIDLALIIVDIKKMEMQFAGANRPLVIIRNGEVIRVKGDNMPIGVFLAEKEHFTNHVVPLEKDDRIYLFSDGIPDQFGYREGRNEAEIFTLKRFLGLLAEVSPKSFDLQKIEIVKTLKRWRKPKALGFEACEQTDDNLLAGLSVEEMLVR